MHALNFHQSGSAPDAYSLNSVEQAVRAADLNVQFYWFDQSIRGDANLILNSVPDQLLTSALVRLFSDLTPESDRQNSAKQQFYLQHCMRNRLLIQQGRVELAEEGKAYFKGFSVYSYMRPGL